MIVTCTQCQTKFKVDDAKIGARGVKVRCSKCQTMIVVRPPEGQESVPDSPTLSTEVPTRVAGMPSPVQAVESNVPPGKVVAIGGSFGLDASASSGPPAGLPPLAGFSDEDEGSVEPTRVGPPPIPAPPPLKRPAVAAPVVAAPLVAAPLVAAPAFALTPQVVPPEALATDPGHPPPIVAAAAPAAAVAEVADTAATSGDDLFADPFANQAPAAAGQKFVDAGFDGPSLELAAPPTEQPLQLAPPQPTQLQAPTPLAAAPAPLAAPAAAPASALDPLAGLPRFDAQEDAPHFDGGMSAEGTVTKPVVLARLEAQRGVVERTPEMVEDRAGNRPVSAPAAASVPVKAERPRLHRVGQIGLVAFMIFGLAGLVLLFRAGGLDGALGRLEPQVAAGIAFERVALAPFVSADGQLYWIVRGEAHNTTSVALSVRIAVAAEGAAVGEVIVAPGAEPDPIALYAHDKPPEPAAAAELGAEQRLPFTAVLPATPGAAMPKVHLSLKNP